MMPSMNTSLGIISTNKWSGNLRKISIYEENSRATSVCQEFVPCMFLLVLVAREKVNPSYLILSKYQHMSANCKELSAIEKRLPLAD